MEISTWGLWVYILLAANVVLPALALTCWWRKGSLSRLPLLRLYLGFSVIVATGVPMITAFGSLSRPQYRHLYTAVDILANLLVCGIAWEVSKTVLPSMRWFIGLWSAGIITVVVLVYAAHIKDNTTLMLKLSLLASFAGLAIIAVCALMPRRFWSREYAAVAMGVSVLVLGNVLAALLQLRWMVEYFQLLRLAGPCISLLSYACFCAAACSPQVRDAEHMGGFVASA